MKQLLLVIALLAMTIESYAQGQGTVRRISSLTNLLQSVDPDLVGVGPGVTYLVPGYYDDTPWGVDRSIVLTKTPGTTNLGTLWRSPKNTNYYARAVDANSPVQNVLFWGARPDNVTDNTRNFRELLSFTNNIDIPVGRYRVGKLVVSNSLPLYWRSVAGSFQGGWIPSTNMVQGAELIYNGPSTNIFVDLSVGMDSTGTNQMIRYGQRIEGINFNANSNALIALKCFGVGRGRHTDVMAHSATGTNMFFSHCQFMDLNMVTTSANDQYPRPTATPKHGIVLDYCQVITVNGMIIESSKEYGLVLLSGTSLCEFNQCGIESNQGGGVWMGNGSHLNSLNGCWFEANHASSNWVWIEAGSYQNDLNRVKMEKDYATNVSGTPRGYFRIDGGYNEVRKSRLGYGVITGTRNKFARNFYNTNAPWSDNTGGNQYENHIDETATYRTNTFDAPFVVYGDYFKMIYSPSDTYPRVLMTKDGILFGDGATEPTVGWSRYSGSSMSTPNTMLLLRTGANDGLLSAYVTGDAQSRFSINIDGTINIGYGGTNLPDLTLYHLTTNTAGLLGGMYAFRTGTNDIGFAVARTNDAYMRTALLPGAIELGDGTAPRTLFLRYSSPYTLDLVSNIIVRGSITLGGVTRSSWPTDADTLDGLDSAYFLSRANHTGTQSYTTITGLGTMATVNDAPNDGNQYARKTNGWVVVTSGSTNIFPTLTNMLVAGANVSLTINTTNQTITISSTGGGGGGATNGTTVSVNGGAALTLANLSSTTGLGVSISGTNITFALVDRDFGDVTVSSSGTTITIDNGVISTNKFDATAYTWINGKGDMFLGNNQTITGTNTFTKPIYADSIYTLSLYVSNAITVDVGGTGTNTHPSEALLVGNGTSPVKHLIASANKVAGWNGSSAATALTPADGLTNANGTLKLAIAAGANVTFVTNGNTVTITVATPTNSGTVVYANGNTLASAYLTNNNEIVVNLAGSTITFSVAANSLDTNKLNSTFYNWINGKQATITFTNGVTNVNGTASLDIVAGSNIQFATNNGKITITASGGSGSSTNVLVNSALVTQANFVNGPTIAFEVSGSQITAYVTNSNPDGFYGGGYLPLSAGLSNALTGQLHRWKNSDIRDLYTETGKIGDSWYRAWGLRSYNGVFSIGTSATNDYTWQEDWLKFDPATSSGASNVLSIEDSGYNNHFIVKSPMQITDSGGGDGQLIVDVPATFSTSNVFGVTPPTGASNSMYATTEFVKKQGYGSGGSGNTNLNQFLTGNAGDHMVFDGTNWVASAPDPFEDNDVWEYKDWDFMGGNTTALIEPGITATAISSGSYYATNYAFNNSPAVAFRSANNDTVITGNGFFWGATGGSYWLGTNIHKVKFRMFWPNTNAASTGFAGWGTTTSSEHTSALGLSWTNMVMAPIITTNSSKVVGTTMQLYPSVNYTFYIRQTNNTARFQITSNGVATYDYTISSNLPVGTAVVWGGVFTKNQSTLATNGATLLVIDRIQTASKSR